ncbi:hypothetical protein BDD43_1190 [Mucilaginibacter gracilis]|uniref:Uncharacterized protein n=2 Tax=Mucilaginibacter TaxID=423349 RepID=H1YHT0_9SPHI|nr:MULTISPECIES: hypothetical protein [Mucilaginibacter]EHQ27480.1 hypothetical protein Mucpa_3381 [Mucilaginibacter paludis DSM 18603]RKR81047.1 hypothetical protein BDD43_1190 [Mucilaginibacter gracilis]
MKTFKASQELIDILLTYGFVEDTHINYPEHAARLKADPYDPSHMKRHFVFKGTREKLHFDYVNMYLPTGGNTMSFTTDELKSLIAFCRLSATDRTALTDERYQALSIPEIISDVKRHPYIYSKSVYKRAKLQFEKIPDIN